MCAGASAAAQRWWARSRYSPSSSGSAGGTRASRRHHRHHSPLPRARPGRTAGRVPQIVVMRHQGTRVPPRATRPAAAEDAGPASGTATSRAASATRAWSSASSRTPSGTIDCLSLAPPQARLELLRYGIDVLSTAAQRHDLHRGEAPRTGSRRPAPPGSLRLIGVAKVRGFMLNVTHYDWTARQHPPRAGDLAPRGRQAVHHLHLVQRSRAGPLPALAQPAPATCGGSSTVWCHPLRRGLGIAPTTRTRPPEGRRLLLHRPAGLLRRLVQRRPASGGLVVAEARR